MTFVTDGGETVEAVGHSKDFYAVSPRKIFDRRKKLDKAGMMCQPMNTEVCVVGNG